MLCGLCVVCVCDVWYLYNVCVCGVCNVMCGLCVVCMCDMMYGMCGVCVVCVCVVCNVLCGLCVVCVWCVMWGMCVDFQGTHISNTHWSSGSQTVLRIRTPKGV